MDINKYTIFDSMKCKTLIDENKIDEAKEYINKCFIKGTGALYYTFDIRENTIISTEKKNLSNLIPDDLNNSEFKRNLPYRQKINIDDFKVLGYLRSSEFCRLSNVHIPTISFETDELKFTKNGKNYLNMSSSLPFTQQQLDDINLKDYEKDIKFINTHLYEVLSGGNVDMYQYFLNFIAFSFKGVKVRTCIYLQSEERTGKGIYMNFLRQCIGDRYFSTSSNETIAQFTHPLQGRTLVNFDELPESGNNRAIQDKLKSLITEPYFDCRAMYSQGYTQKNTFNCIITTNNNAIRLSASNNERYPCADVSTHRKGDLKYFKKLSDTMNKKNVSIAYYKYMLNVYEENKNFNFDTKPETESRTTKMCQSMPLLMKYIKNKYLLNGYGIDDKISHFVDAYNSSNKKDVDKLTIGKELKKHLDISSVVKKNTRRYIISHSDLLEKFKSKNWFLEEFDIIENAEDESEEEEEDKKQEIDYKKKYQKYKKFYFQHMEEIKKMKEELTQLKLRTTNINKNEIEEDSEDEDSEEESDDEEGIINLSNKHQKLNKSLNSMTKKNKISKKSGKPESEDLFKISI